MFLWKPERTRPNITGWTLDNRYRVVERLGQGGMGSVFRVRRIMDDAEFAAKVIKRAIAKDPVNIKRLEREAQVMMAMESPHVTRVYEYCTREGHPPFLVMELLRGRLLANFVQDGPVSPKLAVAIAGQIATGLHVAHSHGLIHRDLKPSNVMLCESTHATRVKLLDFGLVKTNDNSSGITEPGVIVGTADYCAPEQALGLELSPATDFYALACVLYEMLVGWPVFRGDNPLDVMAMHVSEPPPKLSEICPRPVPVRLEEFITICLKKDPEDRLQNSRSVRRHLASVLLELKRKSIMSESTENFQV